MKKVIIIYFSQTDTTAQLSQSVKLGLCQFDIEVLEHRIVGNEIEKGRFTNMELLRTINDCDAVLFGTPTYMGGVAAQFKAFCDSTGDLWATQSWAGKIAGGFTCGSGLNGDQSSTLQYLMTFASQHGMIWVGLDTHIMHNGEGINRLGCQMGATAHSLGELDEHDLATAHYLGERIGLLVMK